MIVKKVLKNLISYLSVLCPYSITMLEAQARMILEEWSPRPIGTCMADNKIRIEYDIQIIVPAYNVEKYIVECLNSVELQKTEYQYLVTVVNDGSTDETVSLIDKIIANWKGCGIIELITQENRGFSGARNAALSKIQGRYVMFLDSDDLLPPDAIQNMLDMAYKTDADILQGEWYNLCEGREDIYHFLQEDGILTDNRGIFSGYPWGKLYKHTVLEHFCFPEGYWFEDTPISFILAAMPYRFAAIKCIVYGYRRNPQGITQKAPFSPKSVDSYWITEECLKEFPAFGLSYDQRAYEYLLCQSIRNWGRTKKQPLKVRKAIFVLTGNLIDIYFKNFHTEVEKMKPIETAIKKREFIKYEMLTLGM